METEGLFRKTASMAAVADLVQQYESGKDINWYQIDDYHLIAGVLMNYLLKLPEPVFPFDAYDSVIEAVCECRRNPLSFFLSHTHRATTS